MGVAGVRRASLLNGDRIVMATGSGPTVAGSGRATNRGAGLVTITGAGRTIRTTAGFGRPILFGDRRGFASARVAATAVGRHCRRELLSDSEAS